MAETQMVPVDARVDLDADARAVHMLALPAHLAGGVGEIAMAHTCPECGSYCTCGGDIDDIDFGEDYNCDCCLGKWDDDYDDYDDYPEDDANA